MARANSPASTSYGPRATSDATFRAAPPPHISPRFFKPGAGPAVYVCPPARRGEQPPPHFERKSVEKGRPTGYVYRCIYPFFDNPMPNHPPQAIPTSRRIAEPLRASPEPWSFCVVRVGQQFSLAPIAILAASAMSLTSSAPASRLSPLLSRQKRHHSPRPTTQLLTPSTDKGRRLLSPKIALASRDAKQHEVAARSTCDARTSLSRQRRQNSIMSSAQTSTCKRFSRD